MKDELTQAREEIARLREQYRVAVDEYRAQTVRLTNALEAARRATQAEADRADLICYKVRDRLAARAYNEAAAYCAEKLQGR